MIESLPLLSIFNFSFFKVYNLETARGREAGVETARSEARLDFSRCLRYPSPAEDWRGEAKLSCSDGSCHVGYMKKQEENKKDEEEADKKKKRQKIGEWG